MVGPIIAIAPTASQHEAAGPICRLHLDVLGQVFSKLESPGRRSFSCVNRLWNSVAGRQTAIEFSQFVSQQAGLVNQNPDDISWANTTACLRAQVGQHSVPSQERGLTANKIRVMSRQYLWSLATLLQQKSEVPAGVFLHAHEFEGMSSFQKELARCLEAYLHGTATPSPGQCLGLVAHGYVPPGGWNVALGLPTEDASDILQSVFFFFLLTNKDDDALTVGLNLERGPMCSPVSMLMNKLTANGKVEAAIKIVKDKGVNPAETVPVCMRLEQEQKLDAIKEMAAAAPDKQRSVFLNFLAQAKMHAKDFSGALEALLTMPAQTEDDDVWKKEVCAIGLLSQGQAPQAIDAARGIQDQRKRLKLLQGITNGLLVRGMIQEAIDLAALYHFDETLVDIVKSLLFAGEEGKAFAVCQRIEAEQLQVQASEAIDHYRPTRHARLQSISLEYLFTGNVEKALEKAERTLNEEKRTILFQKAYRLTLFRGEVERSLAIAERIPNEDVRSEALVQISTFQFYGGFAEKAFQTALQVADVDRTRDVLEDCLGYVYRLGDFEVASRIIIETKKRGAIQGLDDRIENEIHLSMGKFEQAVTKAMSYDDPLMRLERLGRVVDMASIVADGKTILWLSKNVPLDYLGLQGFLSMYVSLLTRCGDEGINKAKEFAMEMIQRWPTESMPIVYLLLLRGEVDLAIEAVKKNKKSSCLVTIVDFLLTCGNFTKAAEVAHSIPEGEDRQRALQSLRM